MPERKCDPRVERKLVFLERELEKISNVVDDAVEDERLFDDDARDIRDCIINLEIQVSDLQEMCCGA